MSSVSGHGEVQKGPTYMSAEDANHLIKKYDKNGESILTKDELTVMILEQASNHPGVHTNIVHDGKVVKEKDVVACKPEKKPFKIKYDRDQIRDIFMDHDIDGDDCLTMSEVAQAFNSLGSMISFQKAHYAMKIADADGDGVIKGQELEKLIDYAVKVCNRN